MPDRDDAVRKVARHQIDLLSSRSHTHHYWVDRIRQRATSREASARARAGCLAEPVTGKAIRYIDWLFPGILGMNMMFQAASSVLATSCCRYRKSGFLKRLVQPH